MTNRIEKINKLESEYQTYLYLAKCLTQDHQQSVKIELLSKAESIKEQFDFLKSIKSINP